MTMESRFEEKYIPEPNSGCWIWIGCFDTKSGYGRFWNGTKPDGAHRVSYRLHNGEIGDLHVCHKCDNTSCVNPQHLFLGTHLDNIKDRQSKGRSRGRAPKLSESDIEEILNSSESQTSLGLKYGVTQSAIWKIKNGKIYKKS